MLPARGVRAGVDRVEADRELIELARDSLFSGRLVLALKGCRPSLIEGDIERGADSMAVISRSSAESVDGTLAILRDAEAKAARVAVAAGFVEAGVNRCCRTRAVHPGRAPLPKVVFERVVDLGSAKRRPGGGATDHAVRSVEERGPQAGLQRIHRVRQCSMGRRKALINHLPALLHSP